MTICEAIETLKSQRGWTRYLYYPEAKRAEPTSDDVQEVYSLSCVLREEMLERMEVVGFAPEYIPLSLMEGEGDTVVLGGFDSCILIHDVRSITVGETIAVQGSFDRIILNCADGKERVILAEPAFLGV